MKITMFAFIAGLLLCFSVFADTVNSTSKGVFALKLGSGYSTVDKMSLGLTAIKNLDKLPVKYSNPESSIELSDTIDRQDLSKTLNVDTSVSGGWGKFSAGASAHYLKHTDNTQYSESFSYLGYQHAAAYFDISQLPPSTAAFTDAAQYEYKNYGIKKFTGRYGDSFIQQLPEGALVVVNLKLQFDTLNDKTSFNGALHGGIGSLFNATSSIQSVVTKANTHGKVELSAYQLGGDPSHLARILKKSPDGNYYIAECNLKHLDNCQKVITSILDYMHDDFSQQITFVNGQPKGNLAIVGAPTTSFYATEFNIAKAPPLGAGTIAARMQLADIYEGTSSNLNFINHFLSSSVEPLISSPYVHELQAIQRSLKWNFSLFDQFNAINCYTPGQEDSCQSIISTIKQYQKPLNNPMLNFFKSGYIAWGIHHYYLVPIGNINYVMFGANNTLSSNQLTIKVSDSGLIIKGIDIYNHEIRGNLKLNKDGSYSGTVYEGVRPIPFTFFVAPNQI